MPKQESIVERGIDKVKPQPGPPPTPQPPRPPEKEWHDSVARKEVVPGLTVRDVGLSVFGETRSLRDKPSSNEPIDAARQKVAHAIINDAELSHRTGKPRNSVHRPIDPSERTRRNREEDAAYESSLCAVREAYLSGHDPTQGANHLRIPVTPDRSNWKFQGGTRTGLALSTQSGPYQNSYINGDVPSRTAWINTYFPGEDELKQH